MHGEINAGRQVGRLEQPRQADEVFRVQRHQPAETAEAGKRAMRETTWGMASILHAPDVIGEH